MNNFVAKYQIKYKATVLQGLQFKFCQAIRKIMINFENREEVLWRNVECSQWDWSVQHSKGTTFVGSIQPKDEHEL